MSDSEIRLEDYGRNAMQNVQVLTKDIIKQNIKNYFDATPRFDYYILLSNKLGYYTVFKTVSSTGAEKVDKFIDFLKNSQYFDHLTKTYIPMINIKHIEFNDAQNHLELWIGNEYFQLSDFSWGVEEI